MTKRLQSVPPAAWLAAILVLNALLKWRFFTGLSQADDFSYGVYAFSLFRMPLTWDMAMDFRVLRWALLFPVALLFRIVPPTVVTAVLYPLALSFGTVVLVYLIGKRVYGTAAGLFAAFAIATFPGDVVYGSTLLPDIAAPFWLALAVWSFLSAEDAGRRAAWWYALSGFAVFLAFITRENSYYFALFYVPFIFNRARWRRGLYEAVVGFALPVVLLFALYGAKSGDFLFNLHLAEHYRDPLVASGYIPPNAQNRFTMLFYMLPALFRGFGDWQGIMSGMYGITFYLGVPLLAWTAARAAMRKHRRELIPVWWFLVVYLFLEFGSISFSEYQMMKKLPRFLLTLTPPMALAYGAALAWAAGFLSGVARKHGKDRIRWKTLIPAAIVMAGVMFTSWIVAASQHASMAANLRLFSTVYHDLLAGRPNLPVYHTGGWWTNKLSFYYLPDLRFADMPWRRSDMLRDLVAVKDPSVLAGSHVILDRRNFSGENDLRIQHDYAAAGPWVTLPPEEWTLLGRNGITEVFEVPEDWTYTPVEGREHALQSLLYAAEIGDPVLFLFNLHPEFTATLTRDRFFTLFRTLGAADEAGRRAFIGNQVAFREADGAWKIVVTEPADPGAGANGGGY